LRTASELEKYNDILATKGAHDADIYLLECEMADQTPNPSSNDWVKLGFKYAKQRDVRALACYEKALALNPTNTVANYNLAQLYRCMESVKDLEKAKTHYKIAATLRSPEAITRLLEMELPPTPNAYEWYTLGSHYHNTTDDNRNNLLRAYVCYSEALKLNRNHPDANYNLAEILRERMLEIDKAKTLYKIAHDNGHPNAREKLLLIENNEGPGLVRTVLFPKILQREQLTASEKTLCITHKDEILNQLMTVHADAEDIFALAANRYTVLGGIIASHRNPPKLSNFFHARPTASAQIVKARLSKIKKTSSTFVEGVVIDIQPDVVDQKTKKLTAEVSSPTLFAKPKQKVIEGPSEQAVSTYATIFCDWSRILYPKILVDPHLLPKERAKALDKILTPAQKNTILEKTRKHYGPQLHQSTEALEALLNSVHVPKNDIDAMEISCHEARPALFA
jgi:TPR repeat protein